MKKEIFSNCIFDYAEQFLPLLISLKNQVKKLFCQQITKKAKW